jgi:hypothetical protein
MSPPFLSRNSEDGNATRAQFRRYDELLLARSASVRWGGRRRARSPKRACMALCGAQPGASWRRDHRRKFEARTRSTVRQVLLIRTRAGACV